MLVTVPTEFVKIYDRPEEMHREIAMLARLEAYHQFPKILEFHGDSALVMNYCGGQLGGLVNRPPKLQVQQELGQILWILLDCDINHHDITRHNLLWHPDTGLHLVDFGRATWSHETEPPYGLTPTHPLYGWYWLKSNEEQAAKVMEELYP